MTDPRHETIVGQMSGVALLPWTDEVPSVARMWRARDRVGTALRQLADELGGTSLDRYVDDVRIAAEMVDSAHRDHPEWCLIPLDVATGGTS